MCDWQFYSTQLLEIMNGWDSILRIFQCVMKQANRRRRPLIAGNQTSEMHHANSFSPLSSL